jgi:hypothetical protein
MIFLFPHDAGFMRDLFANPILFASMIGVAVLGLIMWITDMAYHKRLKYLKNNGISYTATSVEALPVRIRINRRFTVSVKVYYTDNEGNSLSTKGRFYSVRTGWNFFTTISDYSFTANVFVDPNNPKSYAVDLTVDRR